MLHLHRIGPDQQLFEIFDAGHHRRRLALERSLAPADQPLIRLNLDEHIRPVRVRRQRHPEDLHVRDPQLRTHPRKGLGTLRPGPRRRLRHHAAPARIHQLAAQRRRRAR